jgi:hypothetical protein
MRPQTGIMCGAIADAFRVAGANLQVTASATPTNVSWQIN